MTEGLKFATEVIAPTNMEADREGCHVVDGNATVPECLHDAYQQAYQLGWASVTASQEFLRSLETMTVTFEDGDGKVLAKQPGSYLGVNPLNGVLVVIEELKRRGERLHAGDLISSGSYMPPMPVTAGLYTETRYEGIGGTTLTVAASYR